MALACRNHLSGRTAGRVLSARPSRGSLVVANSRVLHGEHGHGHSSGKAWYEKNKDLWTHELKSQSDFDTVTASLPAGKMLVVDYYAPWCAVCKTAYPAMCRIADDKELQQHYVFAKASLDEPEVKDWVKKEGIRGIPHLSLYNTTGVKLMGMGASFKKAETIKSNLKTIAAHKDVVLKEQQLLTLDPNFFVLIPGVTAVTA